MIFWKKVGNFMLSLACSLAWVSVAKAGDNNNKKQDPEFGVTYSTRLDFDSSMIDGKMKAPSGFYLQGRNKQSLSNMVNLRSNFKSELRQSRSGVKAAVH